MDDDWQDDLWDYAQGGDLYDEDEYGEEPYEKGEEETEGEEETGEDFFGDEGGDMEFAPDFKQLQQISFERRSAIGTAAPEGVQKAQRTPEEATLDQVEGVLSSSYSEISSATRQKIILVIEKTKNVQLYNVDVLVLAAIWLAEGRELNRKNLQEFTAKYKNRSDVSSLDLVRYIRTIPKNKM